MKLKLKSLLFLYISILFSLSSHTDISAQKNNFVVVIDAGHGGHDAGAIGSLAREKDINLAVSLKLGEIIEQNFSDVKVVYTRKTDVFLPLQERANIVNNNHANLFLCIHTNSTNGSIAYGTETYTLGLAKSKANLQVAMTENSVILLEDDYKTKYKGFDPASDDSYIMFEFMQDKYIDKSVEIASAIQKQFATYSKRLDRGVRQAGFWVLHRSACPSVLIEVGFISNPAEQRYLASNDGQHETATAIYNAFVLYKKDYDKKNGKFDPTQKYELIKKTDVKLETVQSKDTVKPIVLDLKIDTIKKTTSENIAKQIEKPLIKETSTQKPGIEKPIFKIQLFASTIKLKQNAADFKGIKKTDYYIDGKWYKYTYGNESEYSKIQQLQKEIAKKFPASFIIAFIGTKKVSVKEALQSIK